MNLSDISKKIPVLQKGLSWKYCLVFWIPLLLLARPLFYLVYSPKWIVYWFTDFNWVLPYGGGFGSTRDVIVSNIIRATIMFVPAYYCLIIMHAISKKNSIIEKLVYYLPTITLTLAFIMLYFPNRVISFINSMGNTFRRDLALIWTTSIWVLVIIISLLLLLPRTSQKKLWSIYGLIILNVIVGCSGRLLIDG